MASRSWNRLYVELKWTDELGKFLGLSKVSIYPRLWLPFGVSDQNSDIEDFIGYGQLIARFDTAKKRGFIGLELRKKSVNVDIGVWPTEVDGIYQVLEDAAIGFRRVILRVLFE